ncbi:hypothetical protein ElyMa_003614000 [Elysia marginata]|uniref:Uncharacterized protein n=1 Tax=Elysia marginata TaxID=1093978 RepID=A0AAV4ESL5_9GAST|nr:hypothetical protein ElyMa_003614000 [Elysia marginata]
MWVRDEIWVFLCVMDCRERDEILDPDTDLKDRHLMMTTGPLRERQLSVKSDQHSVIMRPPPVSDNVGDDCHDGDDNYNDDDDNDDDYNDDDDDDGDDDDDDYDDDDDDDDDKHNKASKQNTMTTISFHNDTVHRKWQLEKGLLGINISTFSFR